MLAPVLKHVLPGSRKFVHPKSYDTEAAVLSQANQGSYPLLSDSVISSPEKKNQIIYLTSAASDPQVPLTFLVKISTNHDPELSSLIHKSFYPFQRILWE